MTSDTIGLLAQAPQLRISYSAYQPHSTCDLFSIQLPFNMKKAALVCLLLCAAAAVLVNPAVSQVVDVEVDKTTEGESST